MASAGEGKNTSGPRVEAPHASWLPRPIEAAPLGGAGSGAPLGGRALLEQWAVSQRVPSFTWVCQTLNEGAVQRHTVALGEGPPAGLVGAIPEGLRRLTRTGGRLRDVQDELALGIYRHLAAGTMNHRLQPLSALKPAVSLLDRYEVVSTADPAVAAVCCAEFAAEGERWGQCGQWPGALGFDLEAQTVLRGDNKGRIAVLQLCGRRKCLLFLSADGCLPAAVVGLLESSAIKAGADLTNDAPLLGKAGVRPRELYDVTQMAERIGFRSRTSVVDLAPWVLGLAVTKDKSTTLSFECGGGLSVTQKRYAALDAILARELFVRLAEDACASSGPTPTSDRGQAPARPSLQLRWMPPSAAVASGATADGELKAASAPARVASQSPSEGAGVS